MITDNFLRLSGSLTAGSATGQAVTTTANSTNIVDLSQARDVGEGEDNDVTTVPMIRHNCCFCC